MAKKDENKKGGFKEFFNGVKMEMKKVVWPTKKEVVSYTTVVIITCAVFALGFWIIDTGVGAGLRALIG